MTTVPVPSDAPTRGEPTVPVRLLAVGDIIGGAFRTLVRSPKTFIGMPLLACVAVAVPALALFLLAVGGTRATIGGGGAVVAIAMLAGFALGLFAIYLLLRTLGAVTIGAYRIALGEQPTTGQLWREARGIVWRLIVFGLLISVAFLVVVFMVGFAAFASANVDSNVAAIVTFLAFMAAFPLMIFLSVKFIYCLQTMAIEQADPIAAIRRSWSLSRGFWWPTFGRLLMLYLIGIPVSLLGQGLMVAPIAGLTRSDGTVNLAGFSVTLLIAVLLTAVVNFLYQAFSQIYVTIMYLDARRREGVPSQPPAGYPYAGGPAYQQTPSSAGQPPAAGAHYVGPAAVAGGMSGADPYPSAPMSTSYPPGAPAYPTATTPGEAYPPAGPLWAHTPSPDTSIPDPSLPSAPPTAPLPTFDTGNSGQDSGSSFDSGSAGSDGGSSSSSD